MNFQEEALAAVVAVHEFWSGITGISYELDICSYQWVGVVIMELCCVCGSACHVEILGLVLTHGVWAVFFCVLGCVV